MAGRESLTRCREAEIFSLRSCFVAADSESLVGSKTSDDINGRYGGKELVKVTRTMMPGASGHQ